MPDDLQRLLRSLGKIVAVVVAAGLGGALIGIGLATLTGDDDLTALVSPAPLAQTSTGTTQRKTTAEPTQTPAASRAPTTTSTTTQTSPSPSSSPGRVLTPRVQVITARLGPTSATTGRARVHTQVRITNRGPRPLALDAPKLISAGDEVTLDPAARDAAGPLLRTLASGATASGALRFTLPSAVARRLRDAPRAKLRIATRTILLNLSTNATPAPTG